MGEVKEGKMKLNPLGEIVAQEWQATNKKRSNVQLHEYVIMPDHIHGIIEIKYPIQSSKNDEKFSSPKNTIGSIIRGFKSATTVQVLDCISNQEMHWRRGELTFARNACNEVSAADTSELTFAPKDSENHPSKLQLKSAPFKFWQRGYYDRVIRDRDELNRIIAYITQNPTKWSYKMDDDSLLQSEISLAFGV
jgi:REP element-mobilizing transposase RayT